MKKYLRIFSISWQNSFVYRLNFVMWRMRMVVQLLAVYFLWVAVLGQRGGAFTYTTSQLLTYILGGSIIRSFVFSSRSIDAQGEIATGDLNNYLTKPLNYFSNWFARDLSDKLLNLIFVIIEVGLLIFLLRPPLFLQTNLVTLLTFIAASLLAMVLYFYFSFLVSMTTFWITEENGWPQRFLIFMLIEFFAGGLFPLDILPAQIYQVIQFLPTTYFLNAPMQIYLGRATGSNLALTFTVMIFWLVVLSWLANWTFKKGLKIYGAYGR